ncbi:MAG: type III pantothenate kinase, partial [Prevotellaceae bacterium]|nr:type III pantothenate kinase [Prevotellaceae bacterium]
NLIIDIGNTCAKLVCFDGDTVVEEMRIDKGEGYRLNDFCSKYKFDKGIISSVSTVSDDFVDIVDNLDFPVIKMASDKTPIPIKNSYATPSLGTDRLAAAVGANYLQPGKDILIIDIGTCVTFDFVSADGVYRGGNISLGPTMRLKALHEFTSRLPLIERKGVVETIGTTTETAMRSGVVWGIKYEIEGYVSDFMKKYPYLFVYLTGGVHMDLHFPEKMPIFANDFIVPIGLNRILEYNNEFL